MGSAYCYDIGFLDYAQKDNATRDVIRTAKYKKELVDRRVMEKFHIKNVLGTA
ncbi:hypothetical protein [Pelosinus sp. UFO1]|uniref:hypothetical protein n=1 Tax=Pelosinus sp. UFO1 TaxID=484770 RepID=UPI000ACCC329|nr:hypothetical protein [Pelosinus sp. UFO1]